ncbi:MAG: hypothetical protein BVN35_09425 [Proteobacteria bacterium ST_bin11]|nr:MAG: hypothetical protein BVN35_09425 [Proteobacteria bacterium ST_bin11]
MACVTHGGLQPDIKTPVKTTEKQRLTDGARQYIINFLDTFAGSDANAVIFLNQGYIAGTLGFDLQDAYEQCNAKKGGKIKPLCLRTIQHWKKRKNDVNSCIPKKTREKVDWQTVGWLHLFFVFYRKPQKPSVMEAHRQFKNYWNAKAIGDDCPSHWAVRRLLEVVPELIKEWGRSTGSEYRAYQSFVRRDWSNMSSNEVWVGDGHSFKAKVQSPEDAGQALAPEVTLIIDAASRFIVGWAFSLSENQIAVSESLGNGMLKYGKPLVYYSDNGSGQTAKTIDHPAGGMLARLGVRHETGIPGNPQGRGIIEGIWDITMIAVARDMPTFQGTGMDGGAARKNTIDINAAKKRGELAENVPSWDEFKGKVEARIHWYNTEHQHSALDGKTPADVYFANFDDSWAVHLTDEEKTTLYRPYKERTPTRGEINLHRNIYFSKKLEELPAKAKVRATYDLRDPSKIWVSDLDGVFICEAVWDGNKVAGFPESLMDQLKENRKEGKKKRAMEKYNEAEMEGRSVIEGEVLKRIEFNAGETIEPLKIVQPDFIKQKPEEEKRLSYLDTMKALYGDQKAAGNE